MRVLHACSWLCHSAADLLSALHMKGTTHLEHTAFMRQAHGQCTNLSTAPPQLAWPQESWRVISCGWVAGGRAGPTARRPNHLRLLRWPWGAGSGHGGHEAMLAQAILSCQHPFWVRPVGR